MRAVENTYLAQTLTARLHDSPGARVGTHIPDGSASPEPGSSPSSRSKCPVSLAIPASWKLRNLRSPSNDFGVGNGYHPTVYIAKSRLFRTTRCVIHTTWKVLFAHPQSLPLLTPVP